MDSHVPQITSNYFDDIGFPAHVLEASHVTINRHMHSFFELVFVREGYCLHHVGDSVSLALEGDILLIKPGVTHRYAGTKECKIFNCLFLPEVFGEALLSELKALPGMEQFFSDRPEDFPQLHLELSERKGVSRTLEHMLAECQSHKSGWELRVRSLLVCLLVECSRVYTAREDFRSGKDNYSGYVTHALQYIDEHYAKVSLSVKEIGEQVGVSGDYLSRQFRRMTGIAVQEYLRRYRFARAMVCLQQGCTVSEAAKLNGFHSISYFSREFKKEMGILPSQYHSSQE